LESGYSVTSLMYRRNQTDKKAQLTQTRDVIPRWPSAAILDFIEPEIAPFDPPTPTTLT